jgi:hypothetical protein
MIDKDECVELPPVDQNVAMAIKKRRTVHYPIVLQIEHIDLEFNTNVCMIITNTNVLSKWSLRGAPACPALGLLIVRDRGR